MGGACGTHGSNNKCVQNFVVEAWRRSFRRLRLSGDSIKIDLNEMGCEGGDWIHLARVTDLWRALVNTVMKIRVT
jgi:hypothetical protein